MSKEENHSNVSATEQLNISNNKKIFTFTTDLSMEHLKPCRNKQIKIKHLYLKKFKHKMKK